jgi:TRADD-N domain-containing protein
MNVRQKTRNWRNEVTPSSVSDAMQSKLETCDALEKALTGDLAETVAAHERMILKYYGDVHLQATKSFDSAKRVSQVGFGVLIATLVYTLVFDALAHFNMPGVKVDTSNLLTVGGIGVISGVLIEFIAGINFWLYGRAARQFNAFHICLERTHRYLIAYKMIEKISDQTRDETLEKVVCIMANAPMITAQEIGRVGDVPEKVELPSRTQSKQNA